MFEMRETEAAVLLIEAMEAPITPQDEKKGNPYLFRTMAVEQLLRTALDSESRETVHAIANAFRRNGFRKELGKVEEKLHSMPQPHDERKKAPMAGLPEKIGGSPQLIKRK